MSEELPQRGQEEPGISADVARQIMLDAVRAVRSPEERIRLAKDMQADAPTLIADAQQAIKESDPFYGSVPSSEQ